MRESIKNKIAESKIKRDREPFCSTKWCEHNAVIDALELIIKQNK